MPRPLSSLVLRNFGAGELAPGLLSRADTALYQQGARTLRNFTIQRHGGVCNRTGTKFVAAVKTGQPWLLPFIYNATETYVIEFGNSYARFFRNGLPITVSGVAAWSGVTAYVVGDLVVEGGVNYYCILAHTNQQPPNATYWYPLTGNIYEIPTPFAANQHLLRATQHLNLVTLTHKDYPPQELLRLGDTTWTMTPVVTAPKTPTPTNTSGSAGAAGAFTFRYVVTAVDAVTLEESLASAVITIASAAQPTEAAPHTLNWDDVAGAGEYRVYMDPADNAVFGYIGKAGTSDFADPGYAPDFELVPPKARVLFNSVNNYPHTAAYYQQRRIFANTHANVDTVFASRVGLPHNFSIRVPLQDDDAVTFKPFGPQVMGIQHLIGLERLVMLTDGGEWIVLGDEATGILTPSSIHPEQKGHSGSAAAPIPCVLGSTVIYTQYLSRVVRDMRFNETYTGFESSDLTIFAGHLFKKTIVRMAAQRIPHSTVWCVRDDGVLLGLTYLPEMDTYGWHRHDTGASGKFLDVCVVPEGDEHVLYAIVERNVGGVVRYVERFEPRKQYDASDVADAFFVDCGITYSGVSTTSITGLAHLNGQQVMAWTTTAGGQLVQGPFTVSGGAITLATAATKAQVGLQITAQLQTLPLDVSGSSLREKVKNIQALSLIIEATWPGFTCGPDATRQFPVPRESWITADSLREGQYEVNIAGRYTKEAVTLIQQTNPTPITVLGVLPKFHVGG